MNYGRKKPTEIRSWAGQIPVHNLYTVGVAAERFLRALKDRGVLLASPCKDCRKVFLPPKIFCPYCLRELKDWQEVAAQGQVESWTIEGDRIIAWIRLTSDGGLIHRLTGVAPEKVRMGLKVEACLRPSGERIGSLTDIDSFRPV